MRQRGGTGEIQLSANLSPHFLRAMANSEQESLLLVPHMMFAVINSIALSSSVHVLTPVAWTPDTGIIPQERLFS